MQPNEPTAWIPTLIWGLPFLGMLGSIALLPMLTPRFWHRRMGAVALFWMLALAVPQAASYGFASAAGAVWHAVLLDYLPFISLLAALYVVGGGILLRGGPWGTPSGNAVLLAIGTVLAGVMGTMGASAVLIHPLLRANAHRARKLHLVVFFIVLVGNAGGALSPLGPPLYVGFLQGVPFLWPLLNLGPVFLVLSGLLLAVFWGIDGYCARHEPPPGRRDPFHMRGWGNIGLLGAVVATVVLQSLWHPGTVVLFGLAVEWERLLGIGVCAGAGGISWWTTPRAVRGENMFSWHPIAEVAKLFAAIFVTIAPVLLMLRAGMGGPLALLLRLTLDDAGTPHPLITFWMAGILSAFLDNAPTYLVFFEMAGGDAVRLTGPLNQGLVALAAGSVFFGGLTYIGNAPNMMIQAVAAHRGVRMPGFFGFFAYACALLLPVFVLISLVFFR